MQVVKNHGSFPSQKKKGKRMLLIIGGFILVFLAAMWVWASRGIYLQTETTTVMSREEVWRFFEDPRNLAKWDKSVAKVEPKTDGEPRVGYMFDTIAPIQAGQKEGQRLSYRIEEFMPPEQTRIRLTSSPMFKQADWTVTLESTTTGTRIVQGVKFVPKFQYSFMTPVLYLSQKNFETDMKYLDEALEAYRKEAD